MLISGIQGLPLEVIVVGCYNLEDKEWISRQDPYVCLEYANDRFRTKTCTDGGKNPTFQEKFIFTLVEGLRELNVVVWNSRTLSADEFIGSGRIQLQKALSQGYDDASWPPHSKSGRRSGEVRVILHYSNGNQSKSKSAPSVPTYATPSAALSQILPYGSPAPTLPQTPPTESPYMPQVPPGPYPATTVYSAPSPYAEYPPNSATYPPTPPAGYPPLTQACPPAGYPPQPYPPPPQAPTYYPPGPPSGIYPPSSSRIYSPPSGIYPPTPPY